MKESQVILAAAKTTKSGSTCTATINGQDVTVQVARDLTVAVGDTLVLTKTGSQWVAIQRVYASAPATQPLNPLLPNPKPSIVEGSLICAPMETRSYVAGSGWRMDTADTFQGEYGGQGLHTGAAFYGQKPQTLTGTTVIDAKLRVRRVPGGIYAAQTSTIWLVTQSTRPTGAPTLTSSTTGPRLRVDEETSEFDVPNAWAQAIVDGASGGLAIYDADGSPYVRLAGKGAWSAAWTMVIYWRRS